MHSLDRELERFKTDINLLEYAITKYGYEVDRTESSRNTAVLRSGNDKICVSLSSKNNHWIYWSPRNDVDSGSIIDFLQNRGGGTLGSVRQRLRPHVSSISSNSIKKSSVYIPKLKSSSPDIELMLKSYHKTEACELHPYLLKERCIPESTLNHPIFKGRIRKDNRNNVVFPHHDSDGISGYAIKNKNFTGFSENGRRGLWCSHFSKIHTRLIITESAIDALSYHGLSKGGQADFISIDGELGALQLELLKKTFEGLKPTSQIVIATDNDKAGEEFYQKLKKLFLSLNLKGVAFIRDIPTLKDWNEDLTSNL